MLTLNIPLFQIFPVSITQAQTPTPHITIDGTLEKLGGSGFQTFTEPTVEITQEMGITHGTNLLHSFGRFNVPNEHSVTFSGDPGIANVLSRVTGGELSSIDGELASTIQGANLFLMNPAGVLFGQNATLDVSGSFHVTTADFLRFDDGTAFYADTALDAAGDSILKVAQIEGFGFLGDPAIFGFTNETRNTRSDIRVAGKLEVDPGKTISLVGRDTVVNGEVLEGVNITEGTLQAAGGRVNLASVAALQESMVEKVLLDVEGLSFQGVNSQGEVTQEPMQLGQIILSQGTRINTNGEGGGTVVIRGGQLLIDGSKISANTTGPAEGPLEGEPGAGIDIQVAKEIFLDNGSILESNVETNVAKDVGSGDIQVKADHVELANFSSFQSIVFFGSTGAKSGDINIGATTVLLRDGAFIGAGTFSSADGGAIILNATDSVELHDPSQIFSQIGDLGNAGDIEVTANRILLSGGFASAFPTGLTSFSSEDATGITGDISVKANGLRMEDAFISTVSSGDARAGNIDVSVEGGDVFISGKGDPIGGFFGIFTNAFGKRDGGQIQLTADNLTLTDRASLQAATFDVGNAGGVTITLTGNFEVREGSFVQVQSASTGAAGFIIIEAKDIIIEGISNAIDPEISPEFTGFTADTLNPDNVKEGGSIKISADSFTMTDNGFFSTTRVGPQATENPSSKAQRDQRQAGDITIELTGSFSLTNGSQIFANSVGSATAGVINVKADSIVLSDVNSEGTVRPTAITSTSFDEGGKAGNLNLEATKDIRIENGAVVSTESFGEGDAGNIVLKADDIIRLDQGFVTTKAEKASGGDIKLNAANTIHLIDSTLESLVGGDKNSEGGNISLDPQFVILQTSRIDATATAGFGGNIEIIGDVILADSFSLDNIDASSQAGPQFSGTVSIQGAIQQLSESIAPLPEAIASVAALYAQRCAAQKNGQFSSLVLGNGDGVPPEPGSFLSSPLILERAGISQPTQGTASTLNLTAARLGLGNPFQEAVWKLQETKSCG